jgi:predicted exporter
VRKILALLWLVLVVAALGHVTAVALRGMPLETDIMALLPREEQDGAIQAAKDKMAETLAKRVVVMVGHSDRATARAAAQTLRGGLTEAGLVRPESDIPGPEAIRRLGTAYFPHRAGLLSEPDRLRLEQGRGGEVVTRALSQIYGFGGIADSRLLARDPFMLFPAFLGALPQPANRLTLDEGMLTVVEGGTTWILVSLTLTGEPYALDFQERFVAAFETARTQAPAGVTMLRLGALFYAQAGAAQAIGESTRIGLVSLAGTVLLVLLAFRSARPLLLALTAIGVGLTVALSVCLALFGTLHVAAQLFGASLIGIAVDYALLSFGQIFTTRTRPADRLAQVMPGLTLGAATTIVGYATLALSPFPGLKQVALFSAVGLLGSFLTVVLWFPLLDRSPAARLAPWIAKAAAGLWLVWGDARYRRGRALVLLGMAVLGVAGLLRLETDDDVRRQQGLSPVLAAEQAEIQRLAGFGQTGQFFLVQGDGEQQVLEREEALGARLAQISGLGWQAASRFVPSARRQAETAALVERALIAPHLDSYRADLGMDAPEAAVLPPHPLSLAEIRATGALPFLDTLVVAEGRHVVTLESVRDITALRAAADGLDGVRFVDPTGDLSALLGAYRHRALILIAVSTALMIPLLAARYGWRGAVRVMMPATAAIALTPPLLALVGVGFSFFAAMGLVLVLSIGTDYALFCVEDHQRDPATLVSVCLAMLTTLLSFGVLAASDVAAVRAFGSTMLVGVGLAFILAPSVGEKGRSGGGRVRLPLPVLLAGLLLGVTACAAPPPPSSASPDRVMIAPGITLTLPTPGDLGRSLEVVQMVTARHQGDTFVFEGRLSVGPDRLLLVGTDPMGRRAMTVTWSGGRIEIDRASWLPDTLRPENILADIVVLYWPEAVVRAALDGAALVQGAETRTVGEAITVTWRGDPWTGLARLRNQPWDYELEVRSMVVDQ